VIVNIKIITNIGEFVSVKMTISEDEYDGLVEVSKTYHTNTFDMKLESGGHIIIPPDIINESVMIINIIE
jgi:hypothetical protein